MFKLPYSIIPTKILKKHSDLFLGMAGGLGPFIPGLKVNLKQSKLGFTVKEYLGMCIFSNIVFYAFFGFFTILTLAAWRVDNFILLGLFVPLLFTFFVFLQQIYYPRIYVNKRIRGIERNLLPALQNILIQLNSGVPLFESLVNISRGDYGEVSKEFAKSVREINAGRPQLETLEEIAAVNPSTFFRRAIWQLINGMKSGANMSSVIDEISKLLSEEQILQIQKYGSQLNPLAMFYMLAVVIAPSLGMTFMIVISSFIALPEVATKLMFWGVYGMVVFFQIMFMGIIKSKRPNLLGS